MQSKMIIDNPDDAANIRIMTEKIINAVKDLEIQLIKTNLKVVAVLIPKQPLKSTTHDDYLVFLMSMIITKVPVLIQYSNITTSNNASMQFVLEITQASS